MFPLETVGQCGRYARTPRTYELRFRVQSRCTELLGNIFSNAGAGFSVFRVLKDTAICSRSQPRLPTRSRQSSSMCRMCLVLEIAQVRSYLWLSEDNPNEPCITMDHGRWVKRSTHGSGRSLYSCLSLSVCLTLSLSLSIPPSQSA